MDEQDAVARLQRGNWGGLELLVRRYHPSTVRTAYLITHGLRLGRAELLRVADGLH